MTRLGNPYQRIASEFPAWDDLKAHRNAIASVEMRDLFADNPSRFENFSTDACGLLLDYSKNRITAKTMELLVRLSEEADLGRWTSHLFGGALVNNSEGRAALHMALRRSGSKAFPSDSQDVMPGVRNVLARMDPFVRDVRDGLWRGSTDERISDVVNIGIGGSDLGPALAAEALVNCDTQRVRTHFVSNIDSAQLAGVLAELDPQKTLFVVVSKTFGTQETLLNAESAKRWLLQALGGGENVVARHFVAVSTHLERTGAFGIDPRNVFEFWDWVGGRYSVWSAVGLSVALAIGMPAFREFLAGACDMDDHFRNTAPNHNLPVLLALLGVWYRNFSGTHSHAVLPYDYRLRRLPDYLQQLEMESNGKRVSRDGQLLDYQTCPVIWGGAGSNGQHAFFQLLHQGTPLVPADFILAANSGEGLPGHETAMLANGLAQSQALMLGRNGEQLRSEMLAQGVNEKDATDLAKHRASPGNRPSNTIVYESLSPRTLGSLLAMYEHKVFTQSVVWGINPFDQWGVELGKQLAKRLEPELDGLPGGEVMDCSTRGLLQHLRELRSRR